MLRIELNRLGDQVKTDITIQGKKSDVVAEVLFFHKDHFNELKGITDRLPKDSKMEVLFSLLEEHFEGDDEK